MTPIRTRDDLLGRLDSCRTQLRALGVSRLGVFGSFARDEATRDSDVDLLVDFAPGQKSFDRYMATVELLESVLQRPVEVVTPEALSPYLGPRILEGVRDVAL